MDIKKAADCETIEEVQACLKALEEDNSPIRSAEELDQVEQEIISIRIG